MSALPQTLGDMRRSIMVARAQAVQASRIRGGRHQADQSDIDAGNELAADLATECGFLSPEGERTWLGRRSLLRPDTPYSFDPIERAVVARLKHDVNEVRRLGAQALAVLELTAAEMKQADAACRRHQANIEEAAGRAGIAVDRIMSLATAELDEEKRERSNRLRRSERDFMRGAA